MQLVKISLVKICKILRFQKMPNEKKKNGNQKHGSTFIVVKTCQVKREMQRWKLPSLHKCEWMFK